MEDIIINLQINYNESVGLFNAGNYYSFLQKIRTAIEYLSQYMIYAIVGKDEAEEILDGSVSFYFSKDSRCYKKSMTDYGRQPQGKDLPLLINKVYSSYKNKTDNAITGYSEALCGYYSITSNWSHSGSRTYNESIQAICCASLISAFFDYIDVNKIISERDFQVLKSLNQFDLENENTIAKYKSEINKDRQYIEGLENSKKILEDRITNRNREFLQLQQSNETLKKESEARIQDLEGSIQNLDGIIADKNSKIKDLEVSLSQMLMLAQVQ